MSTCYGTRGCLVCFKESGILGNGDAALGSQFLLYKCGEARKLLLVKKLRNWCGEDKSYQGLDLCNDQRIVIGMFRLGGAEADTPAATRILPFDGLTFTGDVTGAAFKAVLV